MQSPILTYQQLQSLDNIQDVAYTRLFENYLKFELKGSDKLIEVDSTDQESVLMKIRKGVPFHGMIYTFLYINETNLGELQNYKTGKTVNFHDFVPLVFCTSIDLTKKIFKGLNLNMLPKKERLKFFEAYYQYYSRFLNKVEELTEFNKVAVNKEYEIAALSGKNPKLFQHFNRTQNALFNYAYRSYNFEYVRKFRMIEYEEWSYIPFFDAKYSFKKINLELIYKTYYENKNKTI